MQQVCLYTDGACSSNPGPGGWACILVCKGQEKILTGGLHHTTNNQMELMAVVSGLQALKSVADVHIYTDSKYVKDGAEKWLNDWIKKGWKTASKKPVANQGLWQKLYQLMQQYPLTWHWVKGHNGHVYNERVDALACEMRDTYKEKEC